MQHGKGAARRAKMMSREAFTESTGLIFHCVGWNAEDGKMANVLTVLLRR